MPPHRSRTQSNFLLNLKKYGPAPGKLAYHAASHAYSAYNRYRTAPPLATSLHTVKRKRARTPTNLLAGRASKRVKGHKNVRSIVHRKRAVKVSKTLRKKVQKVINGQSFKGTYHTTRFGTIGITTGPAGATVNSKFVREDMGGYVDQNAYTEKEIDFSGNARFWFAHALQSTDELAADSVKIEQGSEWQFFSPLKILDAASVLWNDKAINKNYAIQAGNLNTVVNETTGAPIIEGTAINPQIKGIKIHVDNCYVKFKMKNNSQRTMAISIYNCVPKIKFPVSTPLTAFEDATTINADGANSAYISAETDGYTQLQTSEALVANPAMEPNMLPGFRQAYKYEKVIIRIAPGETITHSVQGPKSYDLDFRKLYDGGVNMQGKAYKGTTMFTMMSIQPDLVYTTGSAGPVGAAGRSGHYGAGFSATNSLADPISIEWEEVYRLSIPEVVGFKTADAVAGRMQLLNKKIPRRAFGNFTRVTSDNADPVHVDFDEENPFGGINQGEFN